MVDLRQVRGSAWVAYLLEKGGFKSLAALHNSLEVVGSVQSWTSYKSGKELPLSSTVKVVDKAIPGSAELWDFGPYGLPVWAVLNGELDACLDLVNKQLMDYQGDEKWMLIKRRRVSKLTNYERVQAMLEITLPRTAWGFPPDAKAQRLAQSRVKATSTQWGHAPLDLSNEPPYLNALNLRPEVSMEELFKMEVNPLSADYEDYALATIRHEFLTDWVQNHPTTRMMQKSMGIIPNLDDKLKPNLINKEFTLAYIALIYLCLESENNELMDAANFIYNGIYQAVLECFGQSIFNFYKNFKSS